MRQHILTEKEKQEKKELATFNRRYAGFKRTIKTEIEEKGLRFVEQGLEFLKEHPTTRLAKAYFDHATHVQAIEESIKEYREALENG